VPNSGSLSLHVRDLSASRIYSNQSKFLQLLLIPTSSLHDSMYVHIPNKSVHWRCAISLCSGTARLLIDLLIVLDCAENVVTLPPASSRRCATEDHWCLHSLHGFRDGSRCTVWSPAIAGIRSMTASRPDKVSPKNTTSVLASR
jgi:hypothetical protein